MASRALLASSSKGAGAELVRGGLLEDQKAGQCYSGVEDLTSNDLCGLGMQDYPNPRMMHWLLAQLVAVCLHQLVLELRT